MAVVENYKDKILQPFSPRVPNLGLGDVEWEDILNTEGHKPEDDSTLGAAFDINLAGIANTHNIASGAVTSHDYQETWTYNAGTEILEVDINLNPEAGNVILFVSAIFQSNNTSTSGVSKAIFTAKYNGTVLWSGVIVQIPFVTAERMQITLAEKLYHTPAQTGDDVFLITEDGDELIAHDGANLVTEKQGYETDTYNISLEFDATANGNRGQLLHLGVYGLVLKR